MSNRDIKRLLARLHEALQGAELDRETRRSLTELDTQIDKLLDESVDEPVEDYIAEQARSLDSRFAAEHPTASRVMREIIDVLGKMGL